ncbi:MAG: phage tail tape measure protein [[Eubacterium] siraeum]
MTNDFNISLLAGLDISKSKGQIDKDINAIKSNIDKLEIEAKISPDTAKNITSQLNNLQIGLKDITIDKATLDGLVNQINSALKGIKIGNINVNVGNQAQSVGQKIGQQISNGVTRAVSNAVATSKKSFDELWNVMRDGKPLTAILDKDGFVDATKTLDLVKQKYQEFGQVKITNQKFDTGELKSFRVNIEQTNGELKETRNFLVEISDKKKSLLFPDDIVKGAESYVHHLDEAKNLSNETGEALNAQKKEMAEQTTYYKNKTKSAKEELDIERQILSAGEKQTEELNKQAKKRASRISYNQGQIDKKGLNSDDKQKDFNNVVKISQEKYNKAYTSQVDKSLDSVSKLKSQWEQQGIYVDEFKAKVDNLEATFKNLQIGDVKGLKSAKQQIEELVTEANRLKKIDKISFGLDTDTYGAKVEQLVAKTNLWVTSNGQARISTTNLSTALSNLQVAYETLNKDSGNTEANQKALIEAEKQLNAEIKTVTSSITSMNASLAKTSQVDSLKQKIQSFYDKNTATHGKWGTELKRMLSDLNNEAGVTKEKFGAIGLELNGIENAARRAGKLGLSFFDTIKQGVQSFSYWTSATAIVMQGITAVRQGVSTVVSLDTALVDLRKTTSMTSDELKQFYYDANDVAKQMGVTTEEIINQASAWSRLGYSTAEASTQMAKLSSQFKLISPGMTSEEATNGLVSVMKAYKMDVDDVKDGIMSPINIVGNNFALDNTNIVNMLQDSVSAMAEANNTLEETIALETAAFEITQDENVGNGFKTVALRLRGISEEGEEVDGTLQNIKSDLYDLTGVSIMQDANTYKSTYQILKEISDVWDNLSDKKRAEALELMFGKHRANIGAAVLSNFSAAEKAMDDMANSAGSADVELSVAMDSIEYKLNHLSETGTGIAQNLFNTEDMKRVLDFVNFLADGLDKITGFFGLFPTAGAGLGAFLGIKDVGISMLVAY